MGVWWFDCDECGNQTNDCLYYTRCEDGHYFCSECSENNILDEDNDFVIDCSICDSDSIKEEYKNNSFHIDIIKEVLCKYDVLTNYLECIIPELYDLKNKKDKNSAKL